MAFRFELDPNRAQRLLLAKSVGARRYVYNWGLATSQRAYEATGKRPQLGVLKSELVRMKRTECPWLYEVSVHIGQQALFDLDRAFDRFLKGLAGNGPRTGFPCFKRKGIHDSARLYEVQLRERHLRLPRIGPVRLKETRSERGFDGRILSATITRRADRWFATLAVEREWPLAAPRPVRRESDIVGVDLGLKSAAVIHDGTSAKTIAPARALQRNLVKLRRLDRELARTQRGSRNRAKAKLRRARLHYRISCQRRDFLHHLSGELARTKPVIVVEDLHVKGMCRNRRLARPVGDAGMGELRRQLAYKCDWYGSTLIVADRFFPSTQRCSTCGMTSDRVRGFAGLKERRFNCNACGVSLDRDENAAINIRRFGLGELGIVPLPEGLRKVTPDGEEGSGRGKAAAKPASLKQEAKARRTRGETRRSTKQLVEATALLEERTHVPAGRSSRGPEFKVSAPPSKQAVSRFPD
jgi:putative transposase